MGRTSSVICRLLRILLPAIPALLAPSARAQTSAVPPAVQSKGAIARSGIAAVEIPSEEIFTRFARRVLFLTCDLPADESMEASGVLVSADGFVVTNAHVVEACRNLIATYISGTSRRSYESTLKYYDKKSDTAVLKIEGQGFDFFNLAARDVRVGERVYAIGNPRGLEQSMSEGIVSGIRNEDGTLWIQHSAPISPGSSGGALISSRGELLGINSWYGKESQNLNFAVPASTLASDYPAARALQGSLRFPGTAGNPLNANASPPTLQPPPLNAPSPPSEEGDAVAQYKLGNAYFFGKGVPTDWAEAARWYRKAADQGYPPAQTVVATSAGIKKDYAEAAKWYRKAADQGYAPAQYELGVAYRLGRGVPEDYAEAATWYRKAADEGEVGAQMDLGSMLEHGDGVLQDYAEAAKWYRKAADQGDARAQAHLGDMYIGGQGVPKDYVLAYMWVNLAASQSTGEDQRIWSALRDALAATMTADQVAEGQRLAREWKPAAQK